jgi:hypothetical protein
MKPVVVLFALLEMAVAAGPRAVTIRRDNKLLEFSYDWPAQAAAIPALDRYLRVKAQAAYAEYDKYSRRENPDRQQFYYSAGWEFAGQSPRLISLEGGYDEFSGGVHPNHSYTALVWDRALAHQVGVGALFSRAGDFAALTRAAYCKHLDRERLKRRGEKVGGMWDDCPKYAELAIAPIDRNKNGRFDRFNFVASPYVAGPYAEGEFEVSLPVTARMVAAMKPEYRSSFEAQRQ